MVKQTKLKRKKRILLVALLVIALVLIFGSSLISVLRKQATNQQNKIVPTLEEQTLVICDTCQGHFGNLAIGVGNTRYTDYLDKQGVKQYGPTTSLWIGDKTFTVHNNETLQVDKYTIFVEEIEVGSRPTGSPGGPPPPVGGGGGLVNLRITTK